MDNSLPGIFNLASEQINGIMTDMYIAIGALVVIVAIPTGYLMVQRVISVALISGEDSPDLDYGPKVSKKSPSYNKRVQPYDHDDLTSESIFNGNGGSWNSARRKKGGL